MYEEVCKHGLNVDCNQEEEKLEDASMMRLMKMNASEWPFIVFGCIMALLQGAVQPAFALIFGIMLGVSCL